MILDKFPNYSDAELRALSHVAAQVLADTVSAPDNTLDASPLFAARNVLPQLKMACGDNISTASLQHLVSDEGISSELVIVIIDQLRQDSYLTTAINDAYDQQQKKMTVAPDSLAAAALLILAVRITNFEWTPKNVKLQFAKSGNALTSAVATLLKKVGI
jgi:hypothetical protein